MDAFIGGGQPDRHSTSSLVAAEGRLPRGELLAVLNAIYTAPPTARPPAVFFRMRCRRPDFGRTRINCGRRERLPHLGRYYGVAYGKFDGGGAYAPRADISGFL